MSATIVIGIGSSLFQSSGLGSPCGLVHLHYLKLNQILEIKYQLSTIPVPSSSGAKIDLFKNEKLKNTEY